MRDLGDDDFAEQDQRDDDPERQVAREAGLSLESLYKALSGERSPDFDTILRVMTALGLKLSVRVGA